MTFFIEIGFCIGLIAAFLLSFERFIFSKWEILAVILGAFFIGVYVMLNGHVLVGVAQSVTESTLILMVAFGLVVLTLMHLKNLKISIDELEYIAMLGVIMYLLITFFTLTPVGYALAIAGFVVVSLPLVAVLNGGQMYKFLYYLSYSAMTIFIFVVLIGITAVSNELFLLPTNVYGGFMALLVGWSIYRYLLHGSILISLIPSRHGWHIKDLYRDLPGHFRDTQYSPLVLVGCFIFSIGSLFILSLISSSVLVNIAIVTSILSYISYTIHKRQKRQYFFTPDQLRK